MGRDKTQYHRDLHQQAYDKFQKMQAFGESKVAAVKDETERKKIFSFNTYQTYWKHTKYFLKWVQVNHPEVTRLNQAKEFVSDWLQSRVDQGLSAWTIHTEEAALNKLYGIMPDDENRFIAPQRKRENIKRSRIKTVRDSHFSETNNDELVRFCKGTGLRRRELENLKGADFITRKSIEKTICSLENLERELTPTEEKMLIAMKDTRVFEEENFVIVRYGKGGRLRYSPIIGKDCDAIVERIKRTQGDKKVWDFVNGNADIHGYRAVYATEIYRKHAREIAKIPYDKMNPGTGKMYQGDVYVCRNDESGRKLDRAAMLICSKALGHNRVRVVADNYLRGL